MNQTTYGSDVNFVSHYALLRCVIVLCLVLVFLFSIGWFKVSPTVDIPLNDHALESHPEAAAVQQSILDCPGSDLKEYKGVADFKGFTMWGCSYKESSKVAFWVVITDENDSTRTITAFISRSWRYAESLVEQGKYVLQLVGK